MDFDFQLKALRRLAQSNTAAAEIALRKQLDKVAASLDAETQYDHLEKNLELLETIGHRFSDAALSLLLRFLQGIESRQITYSPEVHSFENEVAKYQNASTLIARGIEALEQLRYSETKPVFHALLKFSQHHHENVRARANACLESLAHYDIDIFYGNDKREGIGAEIQKLIIEELEHLIDDDLLNHFSGVLIVVDSLLDPTIHGTSWSSKSLTLSQGPTPAFPLVADVRRRSIQVLQRMYRKVTLISKKIEIIRVLNEATRAHGLGPVTDNIAKMIVSDSLDVLHFYVNLVPIEDLQIVQKIEDRSYWIFFHAIHPEIATAARAVENAIREHYEYQIYKTLIGFQGKFGDWLELKNNDDSEEGVDELRKKKAAGYAASITSENYSKWRERILTYVQTESNDLATFPIFYYFLEEFAAAQPKLALQLVSTDSEQIKNFLVALLRTLWSGPEGAATKSLVTSWVEQGNYLWQCTRQFLSNDRADRDMLMLLLQKARELEDLSTVAAIISVATSNVCKDKRWLIDDLFLPALKVMMEHSKADWIFDFWFRRESRTLLRELDEEEIALILKNLLALKTIEYQAEEVLFLIAQRFPQKVLHFLSQRLTARSEGGEELLGAYEAIPFRLHKLNEPLSKIPGDAVRVVREQYEGDQAMFMFRGARLLQAIFPKFPDEFEAELLNIVRAGGNTNFEFVLAVLRNYEGQPFIHKVCKEIIRLIPSDSPFRSEVAIAMESMGVVSGEFGMADAYARRKNEVNEWLTDPDDKIQDFAKWYTANLESMSLAARKRAEEEIVLRKHRFGEQ